MHDDVDEARNDAARQYGFYGELPNYGWVDSFHTAYTLEGLCQVNSAYGIGGDALGRGVSAWRKQFIEPDGWARYYPERRFPLETHCCASAHVPVPRFAQMYGWVPSISA